MAIGSIFDKDLAFGSIFGIVVAVGSILGRDLGFGSSFRFFDILLAFGSIFL